MSQMLNRIANYQRLSALKQNNAIVGIVQLCSTTDKEQNYEKIALSVEQCVQRGAQFVCLPGNFAYHAGFQVNGNKSWSEDPATGYWFKKYQNLALKNQVWLSLGSFPETDGQDENSHYSTHFIVDNEGNIAQKYRKMHILDQESYMTGVQSKQLAGLKIAEPCFTPVGYVGLSVSHDLRFPELYRHLTMKGSQVLLVPSAFMAQTGANHWETLVRTRAIENQAYVIAAAQVGENTNGQTNHGHSMVVDPWGDIIAQSSDKEGFFFCELDLDYLNQVRTQMNCLTHIKQNNLI